MFKKDFGCRLFYFKDSSKLIYIKGLQVFLFRIFFPRPNRNLTNHTKSKKENNLNTPPPGDPTELSPQGSIQTIRPHQRLVCVQKSAHLKLISSIFIDLLKVVGTTSKYSPNGGFYADIPWDSIRKQITN